MAQVMQWLPAICNYTRMVRLKYQHVIGYFNYRQQDWNAEIKTYINKTTTCVCLSTCDFKVSLLTASIAFPNAVKCVGL